MPGESHEYITPEEMRLAERDSWKRGMTVELLMENAGRGIANVIGIDFGPLTGVKIVVVCGSGDNGGDGFVTARYLAQAGARVTVILLVKPAEIKTNEAKDNWIRLSNAERLILDSAEELKKHGSIMNDAAVVVDAIFGTGISGAIREPAATAIRMINGSHAKKVSIDIPSGLDPGTGEAKDPTVMADMTATLHMKKIGLKGNGRYSGRIVVIPIGI